MSGTSLDGVDAVLADLSGPRCTVLHHHAAPFDAATRAELLALNTPGANELQRAALAANALARSYAAAVQALLAQGINAEAFDPAVRSISEITAYDRAFIVLHGRGGEDGQIQGLLSCARRRRAQRGRTRARRRRRRVCHVAWRRPAVWRRRRSWACRRRGAERKR